jgi:arylsulfatase
VDILNFVNSFEEFPPRSFPPSFVPSKMMEQEMMMIKGRKALQNYEKNNLPLQLLEKDE